MTASQDKPVFDFSNNITSDFADLFMQNPYSELDSSLSSLLWFLASLAVCMHSAYPQHATILLKQHAFLLCVCFWKLFSAMTLCNEHFVVCSFIPLDILFPFSVNWNQVPCICHKFFIIPTTSVTVTVLLHVKLYLKTVAKHLQATWAVPDVWLALWQESPDLV